MEAFMESFEDNRLTVYESWHNGDITLEQMEFLLEKMDEQYALYMEGIKEVGSKVADKIGNSKFATAYNNGMNKRASFVANKVVKDPTKGGKVEVSDEVYKKYKEDVLKWRATYKAAEVIATTVILVDPFETILAIALSAAVTRSNDPVDKEFTKMVDNLKGKATAIKDKIKKLLGLVKDKKIDEPTLNREINTIDTACAAVAKQTDRINRIRAKIKSGEIKPTKLEPGKKFKVKKVEESVYDDINMYLSESTDDDDLFVMLNAIIEQVDFDYEDVFTLVFEYLGI